MNNIFYKLHHHENNPTYIEVSIKFNQLMNREILLDKINHYLIQVSSKIYQKNIKIHVSNYDNNKKLHDKYNFHKILHELDIDLYFSTEYDMNIHFFCFSHHIMDGFSFMLFLVDFYQNFHIFEKTILNQKKLKPKKINNESIDLLEFVFVIFSSTFFESKMNYLPVKKNSKESLKFISNFIFHNKNKSFNSHICTCIEKTLIQMKIIKNDIKLLFGLPINYKTIDERKKIPYGNYICIIPDTCNLKCSKNIFVISFVLILTYFLSYLPSIIINKVSNYCLKKIDVIYSNIDAQILDHVPFIECINYSLPAYEHNLMSFSCITWKGQIFFNITTKKNIPLNIFKSCFLSYYECKE